MLHTATISMQLKKPMFERMKDRLTGLRAMEQHPSALVTNVYCDEGFMEITLWNSTSDRHVQRSVDLRINPDIIQKGRYSVRPVRIQEIDNVSNYFNSSLRVILGLESLPPELEFYNWICKRVDYTVDITTPYVAEYLALFKKGEIPAKFLPCFKVDSEDGLEEWKESFYLKTKSASIVINFYDKYSQLLSRLKGMGLSQSQIDANEELDVKMIN